MCLVKIINDVLIRFVEFQPNTKILLKVLKQPKTLFFKFYIMNIKTRPLLRVCKLKKRTVQVTTKLSTM